MPRISRVVDHPDGNRSLDLLLDAHGDLLSATQTIEKDVTTEWIVPARKADPEPLRGEVTSVVLNGEDITERWRAEQPENNEADGDDEKP